MRALAIFGLVASLLLGAIAVFQTNDRARSQRNHEDRALQAAASGELELVSGGIRQTTTGLSLLLVNPAVRALLDGPPPSPAARRSDLADTALALAAVRHSAFLPLSAACLDDRNGRQARVRRGDRERRLLDRARAALPGDRTQRARRGSPAASSARR